MNYLIPLIPTILFIILCVVPLGAIIFIFKNQIRHKKSPLNMELLRSPGQSLQVKIEDLTTDILIKSIFIPLMPITLYAACVTQVALTQKEVGGTLLFIYLLSAGAVIFTLSKDVYRMIRERNLLRLGHECEVAVGQELLQLAYLGFRIFHDFPAGDFNIDHIVVGPQGVFAIETKGRAKPRKQEKDNWKVKFDGKKLAFPGWAEQQPIKQAKSQAIWLYKWLKGATGERVKVTPVLAIPGWWIDRKPSRDMRVFNGKNPSFLAKGPVLLNEKQIESISFHLENKCRDVETKAYNL